MEIVDLYQEIRRYIYMLLLLQSGRSAVVVVGRQKNDWRNETYVYLDGILAVKEG